MTFNKQILYAPMSLTSSDHLQMEISFQKLYIESMHSMGTDGRQRSSAVKGF